MTKPQFCRLEYLTPEGWWVGHEGVNLLNPERYVERLQARGKVGRVVVIDTGQVYEPDEIPDPSTLFPSDTAIPSTKCTFCGATGHAPGECLL